MRNLKKLLALTLAMVMAFSLMLTANAAVKYDDYTDKDSITDEFTEAVQVLTGLEVMQGDEKGFRPSDKITRAEAAAVIYRAVTGDVTNKQNDLYKDYGTFTDVKSDDWFAGYVGYCQNAGYIKGTSPTTFNPYGQVTGYEVLAMILRAVGYGKNNEFTGSSWQVNVAALARQLGVTRNVTAAHMEQTLNMAAPREVVADLVFMTIATVPTVTYTPALAYNDKQSVAGADSNIYNITLGQQVFGLYHADEWQVIDQWGNPGYKWYKNGEWNGATVTGVKDGKGYMVPANHPKYVDSTGDVATVATIKQAADYETNEQVKECDVAAALDFDGEETFRLYVNQKTSLTDTYRIVATDTVTKVGGQGRQTKVYYEMENPWFTDDDNNHDMVVTMVDTMLALVTNKTDAKLDAAGHIITPAQLEVTIYDGMNTTQNAGTNGVNALSNRVIYKGTADSSNWDEYSKGDYILLNAYTNKTQNAATFTAPANAAAAILGNNTVRNSQDLLERAAFETNKVVTGNLYAGTYNKTAPNVWVLQKADSKQGKQTVTSWNTGKHTVDGTEYKDNICLFLDKAGRVTNTTFTWFFDQFGNLIGIGDAHAVNYGVITSVYAALKQGESDTTGAVKAVATVRYADGTTGTVEIDKFQMSYNNDGTPGTASIPALAANTNTGTQYNTAAALDCREEDDTAITQTNAINLWPTFDTAAHPALSAAWNTSTSISSVTNSTEDPAWIYMSASTATNTNAHFTNTVTTANTLYSDAFHILYDTLFEFTVASDDTVVATEVAGAYSATGVPANPANTAFSNKAKALTDNATGKLYKNLAYINVQTNGTDAYVYLNNDTQILVRLDGGRTINSYTLETLPGNVDIATTTLISWADTDGDNRANVVYIQNGSIPSTITYGLFYYNGGAAVWDGTTNTGTIEGYLNGEAKTITVQGASYRSLFNSIQSSVNYQAHLFALQFTNDNVTAILQSEYHSVDTTNAATLATTANGQILNNGANRTAIMVSAPFNGNGTVGNATLAGSFTGGTPFTAVAPVFAVGTAAGNPYTATNEIVYYRDTTAGVNTTSVSYERVSEGDRIVVRGDLAGDGNGTYTAPTAVAANDSKTYWLAPNVKVIGELAWLDMYDCYVTMVYDAAAANAVTEIYISHDSDITPDSPAPVFAGNVSEPSSQPLMNSAITSGAGNSVIYSDTYKPDDANLVARLGIGGASAEDLLYFPFSCPTGSVVELRITNATTGALVYSESGTFVNNGLNATSDGGSDGNTGAAHCFVIDFTTNVNKGYAPGLPMVAGTYNFVIADNTTGVSLSSGSFTMG